MDAIFTAFLIGLLGSLGHCVGMCGPVTLLLTRPVRAMTTPSRAIAFSWLTSLHLGRLMTYTLLGGFVAALRLGLSRLGTFLAACVAPGATLPTQPNGVLGVFRYFQGGVALGVAALFVYMALATIGRVPSVEVLFTTLTQRWGTLVRAYTAPASRGPAWRPLSLGLVWGLLPCGLVYSALLIAATAPSVWQGGVTMLAFGAGTLPAMATAGWLGARGHVSMRQGARYLAALLIFLVGVQMALRGLAAWGVVGHARVGEIMLW